MNIKFMQHRFIKVILWSFSTALLLALMLQPMDGSFLSLDSGVALAQSGSSGGGGSSSGDTGGFDTGGGDGEAPTASFDDLVRIPAGTSAVNPIVQTIPPNDNIPAIVGNGIIALIPSASNSSSVVNASLGCTLARVIEVADPALDRVVRIQEEFVASLPVAINMNTVPGLPSTSSINGLNMAFQIDVFEALSGADINVHSPNIVGGILFCQDFAPATPVLLQFDPATETYGIPVQQWYPASRTLRYELSHTSLFAVALVTDAGSQAFVAPAAVIPAGLPRTGGGSGGLFFPGLFIVTAGLVVGFVLWRKNQ